MERVKSSDVLDVTHQSNRRFRGVIVGYFRPIGPNAWDDYQFIRSPAVDAVRLRALVTAASVTGELEQQEVLPNVPLQLESRAPEVRMRSGGRVVRVHWLAEPADVQALGAEAEPRDVRRYFVGHYLTPLGSEVALGEAALVARKLSGS
jgi:hypothetical protein